MRIFISNNQCFNVDNGETVARLLAEGAKELSAVEIKQYGMEGYENLVSPLNTVVNADGTVSFTPPPAPPTEELFAELRVQRDARLAASDFRVLPDAPGDTAAWMAYRQALRDLPAQPGAPWTSDTIPWPVEPK